MNWATRSFLTSSLSCDYIDITLRTMYSTTTFDTRFSIVVNNEDGTELRTLPATAVVIRMYSEPGLVEKGMESVCSPPGRLIDRCRHQWH